ncbi:hypothetical protein [Bacillus sp. Marseille-Q3570]|uniref:hypothetical protein n=1 Tax=Bacillus sp. Marseille-Q3570 TaxID=2963522 RepID=UPI0021B83A85|nr:hypothetical protein [Bacillus sp. Marseille-Q3570]
MDENKIMVVLVKPGQLPQSTYIPNDLKYFEELVDGPVSVEKFFISGYRLVCSVDEGYGYENSSMPLGTYFITRYHTSFETMETEESEEIKKALKERSKKRKKKKGLFSIFSK